MLCLSYTAQIKIIVFICLLTCTHIVCIADGASATDDRETSGRAHAEVPDRSRHAHRRTVSHIVYITRNLSISFSIMSQPVVHVVFRSSPLGNKYKNAIKLSRNQSFAKQFSMSIMLLESERKQID